MNLHCRGSSTRSLKLRCIYWSCAHLDLKREYSQIRWIPSMRNMHPVRRPTDKTLHITMSPVQYRTHCNFDCIYFIRFYCTPRALLLNDWSNLKQEFFLINYQPVLSSVIHLESSTVSSSVLYPSWFLFYIISLIQSPDFSPGWIHILSTDSFLISSCLLEVLYEMTLLFH